MAGNVQTGRAPIVAIENLVRLAAIVTVVLAAWLAFRIGNLQTLAQWYDTSASSPLPGADAQRAWQTILLALCGSYCAVVLAFSQALRHTSLGTGAVAVDVSKDMCLSAYALTIVVLTIEFDLNRWLAVVLAVGLPAAAIVAIAYAGSRERIVLSLVDFGGWIVGHGGSDDDERPRSFPLKVVAPALLGPVLLGIAGLLSATALIQFGYTGVCILLHAAGSFLDPSSSSTLNPSVWQVRGTILVLIAVVGLFLIYRAHSAYQGNPVALVRWGMRGLTALQMLAGFATLLVALASIGNQSTAKLAIVSTVNLLILAGCALVVWQIGRWLMLFGLSDIAIHLRYAYRSIRFWRETRRILGAFPQPDTPRGYLFVSTQADTYTIASLLLILCRLRQLGWLTIVLDRWPFRQPKLRDSRLNNLLQFGFGEQRVFNYDWKIDWDNKIVEAAGINFYQPIWEGLSRHFGRYTIKLADIPLADRATEVLDRSRRKDKYTFEDTDPDTIFNDILKVTDSTLLVCFRIFNTLAGQGFPVRIIGGSGQFVPNAIYNIFCREIGKDRDMHFVWIQQGYQTYYKDKSELSTRISLQNMTRKWPYSNPYLPHKDDFDNWMTNGHDVGAIIGEARSWAETDRATSRQDLAQPAAAVLDRISEHRAKGGKVVCLFGKMVFDLSTPWERGPAHSGMDDWINHTVESVRGYDDILLLIKPHPYEARPEIAGRVEQYFADMIATVLPPNALILSHDWFNLHRLFPHIDAGVLWNGTSGLELGLQGIPVLMCSDWGPIDYPIGFCAPRSRADYEEMIRDPSKIAVPPDYIKRCAMLLKYTSEDEVMIPYRYAGRPLTNKPFGPPYWYLDEVDRFIVQGDPWIDLAASRVE